MEEKYAYGEPLANSRALVEFLNDNKIPKEDIVTVLDGKGQLILIYYK